VLWGNLWGCSINGEHHRNPQPDFLGCGSLGWRRYFIRQFMGAMIAQFNTATDGSMRVPSEYAEIIVTKA